jgi:mannosyltransferase
MDSHIRSLVLRKNTWLPVLLILAGLLIPGKFLIESLRQYPDDPILTEKLFMGASLFKAGLILIGFAFLALSSTRIRERLHWSEAGPLQEKSDRYTALVLILLIVSFAVRLYKLGEGLWLDEIGMYLKYLNRPFGEFLTTYDSENQHFLYTIFAHFFIALFEDRAWGMRFPAVLFGVASIGALYLLGREVTSKKEALLAAALLSLSYYHVWFSQNARGYTGLLFWTLLSSWYFVRAISGGPTRLWIYYAAAVALGAFTQLIMVFIAAGHFLIYLHRAFLKGGVEIRWSGLLVGFVLSGILTFQLYSLVLPQFFSTIGMKGTVAIWNSPFWTLTEIIRGMKMSFAGGFVALAASLVFFAGLRSYSRTNPVLIAILILPPLLGSIVVLALRHPLWPRFFFFAFGFGSLVVIRGGMVLARWLRVRHAEKLGIVVCCSFIIVSALSIPRAYLPKQDFEGARTFIEEQKEPGDKVVTVGRASAAYQGFYKTDFEEVKSVERLEQIRATAARTWLVYMIPEDVRAVYPEVMASIEKDFTLIKKFPSPLADGPIYVCVSR